MSTQLLQEYKQKETKQINMSSLHVLTALSLHTEHLQPVPRLTFELRTKERGGLKREAESRQCTVQ